MCGRVAGELVRDERLERTGGRRRFGSGRCARYGREIETELEPGDVLERADHAQPTFALRHGECLRPPREDGAEDVRGPLLEGCGEGKQVAAQPDGGRCGS